MLAATARSSDSWLLLSMGLIGGGGRCSAREVAWFKDEGCLSDGAWEEDVTRLSDGGRSRGIGVAVNLGDEVTAGKVEADAAMAAVGEGGGMVRRPWSGSSSS